MSDVLSLASPGVLALLLAAGAGTGLLSGLLGIGGGVIVVPVLMEILSGTAMDPALHAPFAIGTAHGVVLLASLSSALAHARAGRVEPGLMRAWLPFVAIGAVVGLVLAAVLAPVALLAIFALVAAALGLSMLADGAVLASALPGGALGAMPPTLVGLLAAALGIGGGTLSGPTLAMFSVPLLRVIGVGSVFNIVVAVPATLAFALAGIGVPGLPGGTLGYVGLVPLVALTVPALLVAPWAARLAPRLPVPLLRRLFALCLLGIAVRMGWRLLA